MTLRRQPLSPITLLFLLDAIKTFEIIQCSALLDKIYRHQRVPFLAHVLVATRGGSSTLPHLFPDLNPISLFGTILHAPPPTLFTAFLALNVANFTSVKRADVYLTDSLNTFVS